MVNFRLYTDDSGSYENFIGEATYAFNKAGLLVIEGVDGARRTYSPGAWRYVEDLTPQTRPKGSTGHVLG